MFPVWHGACLLVLVSSFVLFSRVVGPMVPHITHKEDAMSSVADYEIVTLLEDEEFVNEVIEQALGSPR